jgi:hypothetical protein
MDISPTVLEAFTQGRLSGDDPYTEWVLDAALEYARSYCRWHVSPVIVDDTRSLDGPGQWGGLSVGVGGLYYASGSYLAGVLHRNRVGADTLYLPTKHLLGISSIIEDGVALDLSQVQWSTSGAVCKTNNEPWTTNYAGSGNGAGGNNAGNTGVTVEFTHGYSETDAADWRRIVLMIADRMSLARGLIGGFNTEVGPYKVSAYYGTSRPALLPKHAGWLDDLTAMIANGKYVRLNV